MANGYMEADESEYLFRISDLNLNDYVDPQKGATY